MLEKTSDMPVTSTPSPGEFEQLYRKLAEEDPDILSIHISSGLSGTYNAACTAAANVKNANIKLVDTLTLSVASGWQLMAAINALKQGQHFDGMIAAAKKTWQASDIIFTLPNLAYLIHGGRISHLKGLLASLLGIKPLIGVTKTDGKYYDRGKQRTFAKACQSIPLEAAKRFPAGTALRVQVGHAGNPEGAESIKEAFDALFKCEFLPSVTIAPALGAHTGRGLVGALFAPLADLP